MENQICVDLYTEKTYFWMTQYPLKKVTGAKWCYFTIMTDEKNLKDILKYASKYHIKYDYYGKQWSRSSNYRDVFFTYYKPPYRCRYCNKKLTPNQVVVDHIIPISKVKKSKKARKKLTLWGIKDVNDPRNLAPACKSCNKAKSNKMGLWCIRGFLGQYKIYRPALYVIFILAITIAAYSLYATNFAGIVMNLI